MKLRGTVAGNGPMILLLGLNSVFVFLNPDKYMGIAQYYVFLVAFVFVASIGVVLRNRLILDGHTIRAALLLAYLIVPLTVSAITGFIQRGYVLTYFTYTLTLFLALQMRFDSDDIRKLFRFYCFSAVIIACLILVQRLPYNSRDLSRHTIQVAGHEAFDPNMLSAYLIVPALILLARFLRKRKPLDVCFAGLLMLGMLMTSSRGAMVSLAVGVLILFGGYMRAHGSANKKIAIILLAVILLTIVLLMLPENSFSRLFVNSYDDKSNSIRLLNWKAGIQTIVKRPIFGYGFGDELDIIKQTIGENRRAHNTYLGWLLQFGVVGFTLITLLLFCLYRSIRKNYVLKACLFSTLAVIVFISAESDLFLWLPIIYISVVSQFENKTGTINSWLDSGGKKLCRIR